MTFFGGKLDHRVISDNRKFWKTISPLFSEKAFPKESVVLNKNNKTNRDNEKLAETFNEHLSKLVESLDIDQILASNITSHTLPILFLMLLQSTNIIQVYKKINIS